MNDLLRIEWNLGNSCNLKCSYCSQDLNNGTNPFPNYEVLRPAFDHIVDQTRAFSSVQIEITGGEPTDSPALKLILAEKIPAHIRLKLISNGMANLNWWTEVKNKLSAVQLSYHATTDFDHFFSVVKELNSIETRIMIVITPETWSKQKLAYDILKTFNFDVHLQLLYSNFTKGNNEYLKYSTEQWNEYYCSEGINPSVKKDVVQTIEFKRQHRLNDFFGHLCWAGVNQIVIDNFGDVWRGWCKANEPMGNIYKKTMLLDRQPRVCPRNQCKNGFDLQARKSDNSWGFA